MGMLFLVTIKNVVIVVSDDNTNRYCLLIPTVLGNSAHIKSYNGAN